MKQLNILFGLVFLFSCTSSPKPEKQSLSPEGYYSSDFFHKVQMERIFADSKTFTDHLPKLPYGQIINLYNQHKRSEGFDLHGFIGEYYEPPRAFSTQFQSDKDKSMEAHILSLWPELTRNPDESTMFSSLIPLPKKYVVPGGRFREIYYWDSYFTIEGLLLSDTQLAEDMVDNFAFLIDSLGFIPNGNRNYYLTRSQPPFFSLMVNAISRSNKGKLLKYLAPLEREYNYWMQEDKVVAINGNKYNRYYDTGTTPRPESYREDFELAKELVSDIKKEELYRNLRTGAMSGWDFSSRWFSDNENLSTIEIVDIIPVDLNCLLYYLEDLLAKAYELQGDAEKGDKFAHLAGVRGNNIRELFWNSESHFFEDFHLIKQEHTKRKTLAGAFPLFVKVATESQAEEVQKTLAAEFLGPGGFVTSLQHSGQQWDAPNGWAPLQWITIAGLSNYGYKTLEEMAGKRWLNLNRRVYQNTGKMMEKYNVMDTTLLAGGGEYSNQDGFGWTNGVALRLLSQYQEK